MQLIVQQSLTSVLPSIQQENLSPPPPKLFVQSIVRKVVFAKSLKEQLGKKLFWVLRTLRGKAAGEGKGKNISCKCQVLYGVLGNVFLAFPAGL